MKQLPYILAALLLTVARIAAPEVNASSSKAGIFGIKPEYVHVLLNPLPVYGLGIGIMVLWIGFLTRNMTARKLGLIITAVCAASAWPVLYYGQHAYNSLAPMLDTESEQWLDIHMQRAERFIYGFYATAALAIASVVAAGKWPRTASALAGATLVLGTASLGLGAWISRAGGQVSHSEFRGGEPPEGAPSHQHEPSVTEHPHDKMQMPATDTTHQHGSTSNQPQQNAQTAGTNVMHQHEAVAAAPTRTSTPPSVQEHAHEKKESTNSGGHIHARPSPPTTWMPDTPEGIWTQVHRHHSALGAAVKAKEFDQVHPHAVAIEKLTAALVNIVHPDHKVAVQSGADKAKRLASDVHKSAHAEDAAGAEGNLKLFDAALQQLEELMKKQ